MLKGVLKLHLNDTIANFNVRANVTKAKSTLELHPQESSPYGLEVFNKGSVGLQYSGSHRVFELTKTIALSNEPYEGSNKSLGLNTDLLQNIGEFLSRVVDKIVLETSQGKTIHKEGDYSIEFTPGGKLKSLIWVDTDLGIALALKDDAADKQPIVLDGVKTNIVFKRIKETSSETSSTLGELNSEREVAFKQSLFHHKPLDLITANKDLNFEWLLTRKYTLVTDLNFYEVVEYLNQFDLFGMDTETTGLNITFQEDADKLVGIVLSPKIGESFYFPVRANSIFPLMPLEWYNGDKGDDYNPLTAEPVGLPVLFGGDDKKVVELLTPILQKKQVVFNASFDFKVFLSYGIFVNIFYDVRAAFVLVVNFPELAPPSRGSLSYWTERFLERDSFELSMMSKNGKWNDKSGFNFMDLPYELVRLYAGPDTDNTLELYKYIEDNRLLEKYNATKVHKIETQFACAIGYSEFYGHHITDQNMTLVLNDLNADAEASRAMMNVELEKVGINPEGFNPRSSKVVMDVLYNQLKYPKQYAKGKLTANKKALKTLAKVEDADGNPRYPLAAALRSMNETLNLISSFESADKGFHKEFAHSNVSQYLETGRVSTSNPNYQAYNDPIKKYVTPREGYYMIDLDYSSIESRVMVSMAGDQYLIDRFRDPDMDYHRLQAGKLYSLAYEDVTSDIRQGAKVLNFGIPYGMGAKTIGGLIWGVENEENTKKAEVLLEKFYLENPDLERFFNSQKDMAVREGYTETLFGRRRYYNLAGGNLHGVRRQGGNAPIQGTAADIFKMAAGRLMAAIASRGLQGKILITGFIHDEMLLEVHNSLHPLEAMKVVREAAEYPVPGVTDLFIGMGFGRSWYEAKGTMEMSTRYQLRVVGKPELYPNWTNDINPFLDWMVSDMFEAEKEFVILFMTDASKDGEQLTLTEYDTLRILAFEGKAPASSMEMSAMDLWSNFKMRFGLDFDGVEVVRYTPRETSSSRKKEQVGDTPEQLKARQMDRFKDRVLTLGILQHQEKCYMVYNEKNIIILRKYIREGTEGIPVIVINPDTRGLQQVKGVIEAKDFASLFSEIQQSN